MSELKQEITQEIVTLRAPEFPDPEPLDFDKETIEKIETAIDQLYRDGIRARSAYQADHLGYDNMYRGNIGEREGPWENSANLHVQMPYWLVDSISTRQLMAIWEQMPLIGGYAVEDDDRPALDAAKELIMWHFDEKRMNAFENWAVTSRIRNIHGNGVFMVPWVTSSHLYRGPDGEGELHYMINPDGTYQLDEAGDPIVARSQDFSIKRQEGYNGPIMVPIEWDDLISSMDHSNLQPKLPHNPLGADWAFVRQWENLSLIWKKRKACYPYIDDDEEMKEKEWWLDNAPSQDRSTSTAGDNNERIKQQDRHEGRDRGLRNRKTPIPRPNPEFEMLYCFMPWEVENEVGETEEVECLMYYCLSTKRLVGAFMLTDVNFRNRRPLVELHYQKVGTRWHSMGVSEICRHLSAEIDTLHNMRLDVGFATNLPFFFMKNTAIIKPENLEIRPLAPVPVDDPSDIVFPPTQNVTTFYYQEEQMLFTLVERVMGVTDLFLGVSPTKGAASRHATGFVGTQQEALARMTEIIKRDAAAFSFLCHLVYDGEMQFGPRWRKFRLAGKSSPLTMRLNRHQLWMQGEFDFTLGANQGMHSQMIQQQRAQQLAGYAATSPLVQADMGRLWEVGHEIISSLGYPDPDRFIGPRESLPNAAPKEQDEENGEMVQFVYGKGVPAPVSPNDDDQTHLQDLNTFVAGETFMAMGRPNMDAFMNHAQLHIRQMQQKQMQQQQMAMNAAANGPGSGQMGGMESGMMGNQPGAPGQQPEARNVAQLSGMGSGGQMGAIGGSPTPDSGIAPPSIGG